MSKRLGGTIGCKDKTSSWHINGFPDGSNIGSVNPQFVRVDCVLVFLLSTQLTVITNRIGNRVDITVIILIQL